MEMFKRDLAFDELFLLVLNLPGGKLSNPYNSQGRPLSSSTYTKVCVYIYIYMSIYVYMLVSLNRGTPM